MKVSCSSSTSDTIAAVTTPSNGSASKDANVDNAALQRFVILTCIKQYGNTV